MKKIKIVLFNLVVFLNFLYAVDDIGLTEYVADGFDYPLDHINENNYGYEYSQPWGNPATTLHSGIDINTVNDCGREVKASASGIVVATGDYGNNWGGIILLKHKFYRENGFDNDTNDNYVEFTTQYAHIAPLDSIEVGDYVYRGQHIGYIAWRDNHNDCNDFDGVTNPRQYDVNWSPHLHFEVRSDTTLVVDNWENFDTEGTGYERKDRVDNEGYFLPFNSDLNNHSETRYVDTHYPDDVTDNALEWFATNPENNTPILRRMIDLNIFNYTEDDIEDNRRLNKNHILTKRQVIEIFSNVLSLKLVGSLSKNSLEYAIDNELIGTDIEQQIDFNLPVKRETTLIIATRVAQRISEGEVYTLEECSSSSFDDIEQENFICKHTKYLYDKNIFLGYLNNNERLSFSNSYTSRDFISSLSDRLYDLPKKITYKDTTLLSDEYKKAIDYLSNDIQLFEGVNGEFKPGEPISRAEFSKVIVLMLEKIYGSGLIKKYKDENMILYEDRNNPDWFLKYARVLVGMDIMHGTTPTTLEPMSNVKYREVAKMIGKLFFYGKVFKPYSDVALNEVWENIRGRLWHQTYYNCFDNSGDGYTFIDDDKNTNTVTSIFEQKTNNVISIPGKIKDQRNLKATRKDVALFLYRAYMLWKNKIETDNCVVDVENEKEGWGL